MNISPFDAAPEFSNMDNRRLRVYYPISTQHLNNKHEVLLPTPVVKGKRVLDLGSCIGATGHWCLSMGAAWYTGVETQKTYTDISQTLLQKYHPGRFTIEQTSVEDWLSRNTAHYDVTIALGVLFAFTDYYSILRHVCDISDVVAIEGPYPEATIFGPEFCGVQFLDNQRINLADENASLVGRGTRISPKGLQFIMRDFGFESHEGLLYPQSIVGAKDMFNDPHCTDPRYLIRFSRTGAGKPSLSQDLRGEKRGDVLPWSASQERAHGYS